MNPGVAAFSSVVAAALTWKSLQPIIWKLKMRRRKDIQRTSLDLNINGFVAPVWFRKKLIDIGFEGTTDPGIIWFVSVAVVVILGVGSLFLAGAVVGVVVVFLLVLGPTIFWAIFRDRGNEKLSRAMPSCLESIARGLRSGASLRVAIADVARNSRGVLKADLEWIAGATSMGSSFEDVLGKWSKRRPTKVVQLASSVLLLGAESGGAQAEAIEGAAETIRQRIELQSELRAQASQARASALLLVLAPLLFGFSFSALDSETGAFLFHTGLGAVFLICGLTLDGAAAIWMNRIVKVSQ